MSPVATGFVQLIRCWFSKYDLLLLPLLLLAYLLFRPSPRMLLARLSSMWPLLSNIPKIGWKCAGKKHPLQLQRKYGEEIDYQKSHPPPFLWIHFEKQKLIDFTYSEFRRSTLTAWSYAEDRLPPVKIRAHSDPSPSNANGCKNCPNTTSCRSIATSKNSLCNKWERFFVLKMWS